MSRINRFRHGDWWPMNPGGLPGERPAPTPAPAPRPQVNDDLPAIRETRPTWWQVSRLERDASGKCHPVLIFESRDEDTALRVCMAQKYRCRVTKWGDARPPFENFKDFKVTGEEEPRRI